jgi:hypothetical protein
VARARETPPQADLNVAQAAFEVGDFRRVRQIAALLLADTNADAQTRAGAQALLDRLKVDPLILWLTVACGLFFIVTIAVTMYR